VFALENYLLAKNTIIATPVTYFLKFQCVFQKVMVLSCRILDLLGGMSLDRCLGFSTVWSSGCKPKF
jgi:hypothetical protein